MLDVVVLTVNPSTFAHCVRSLNNQEVLYHGIVVQNGKDVEVPEGWTVVSGSREQNYSQSLNRAFENLRGDKVLLCSDDAYPWEGCISSMLSHDEAVVGSVLVNTQGVCNHVGMTFADDSWPAHLGRGSDPSDRGSCRHVDAVTYALVMIDRDVIDKVGPFDEDYQWSHEDVDYGLRIREAGFGQPMLCTDAVATHDEHGVPDTPRNLKANVRRYNDEWIVNERLRGVLNVAVASAPGGPER